VAMYGLISDDGAPSHGWHRSLVAELLFSCLAGLFRHAIFIKFSC
jgi:hypothetical protein